MIARSRIALLAMLATVAAPADAFAADTATGQRLANSLCTNCHVVEPGGSRRQDVTVDVPSFMAVAVKSGQTADKIQAYILNPHPPMPEVQLSTSQLADMAAYIMSLKP